MKQLFPALFLTHLGATLGMAGLCWFVQVVHYPLFAAVGEQGFGSYAQLHAERTSWVVAPLMLTELASGFALLLLPWPREIPLPDAGGLTFTGWLWVAMGMLAAIWVSTFFVQVPLHAHLAAGFDPLTAERLVRTNWWRTGLWTVRGLLLLSLLHTALAAPANPGASSIQ